MKSLSASLIRLAVGAVVLAAVSGCVAYEPAPRYVYYPNGYYGPAYGGFYVYGGEHRDHWR